MRLKAKRQALLPPADEGNELVLIASLEGQIRDAARSDVDVLISGGTERVRRLLAKVIHRRSTHGALPFVTLHADALSKPGRGRDLAQFPSAATVFVEEVSGLSANSQQLFGQLLERRAFNRTQVHYPSDHLHIDPRVVVGTAHDLATESRLGTFSPQLFYRLNAVHIVLPVSGMSDDLDRTA